MVSLLWDTHVLIWVMTSTRKISGETQVQMKHANNFISIASFWELGIKIGLGKLDIGTDWARDLDNFIEKFDISVLPITEQHCELIAQLPLHHRDPFDRMLIAQAQYEKLVLVTADKHMLHYDIEVIW